MIDYCLSSHAKLEIKSCKRELAFVCSFLFLARTGLFYPKFHLCQIRKSVIPHPPAGEVTSDA